MGVGERSPCGHLNVLPHLPPAISQLLIPIPSGNQYIGRARHFRLRNATAGQAVRAAIVVRTKRRAAAVAP